MIPVSVAVAVAARTYEADPTYVGAGLDQSVHVIRTDMAKTTIFAVRGTTDLRVWMLDFMVRDAPIATHPDYGRLHAGFLEGANAVLPQIVASPIPPDNDVAIVGHSFGGSVALALALLLPVTHAPAAVFCFAPGRLFADAVPDVLLGQNKVWKPDVRAWRYGNDPVPDVPSWFMTVPLMPIGKTMSNPVDCHHVGNYVAALSGL